MAHVWVKQKDKIHSRWKTRHLCFSKHVYLSLYKYKFLEKLRKYTQTTNSRTRLFSRTELSETFPTAVGTDLSTQGCWLKFIYVQRVSRRYKVPINSTPQSTIRRAKAPIQQTKKVLLFLMRWGDLIVTAENKLSQCISALISRFCTALSNFEWWSSNLPIDINLLQNENIWFCLAQMIVHEQLGYFKESLSLLVHFASISSLAMHVWLWAIPSIRIPGHTTRR